MISWPRVELIIGRNWARLVPHRDQLAPTDNSGVSAAVPPKILCRFAERAVTANPSGPSSAELDGQQ